MAHSSPISRPSRIGRLLTLLMVTGVALSLTLGGSGALAQKGKKKPAPAEEKKAPAKKDGKSTGPLDGDIVLKEKADAVTLAKTIDKLIDARLKEEKISASPSCTDAEFIRRAYLDLVGIIPTAEAVEQFLASKEADRRSKLIDSLLQNSRHGKFSAELWTKDLLNKESANRRLGETAMFQWLDERFNDNTAWDKLVYDLLTASGPQDKNGAVTFFISNNGPEKLTDKATQHFLGVQLQCAQCHNHPFTDYKQTEYWGMAAFFMQVSVSANPKQAAKNDTTIEVTDNTAGKGKKLKLPMDAKIVAPTFLQGGQPSLGKGEAYRPVLAKWMTSKDNPYFARAAVNKIWFDLFGRGLVNPYDDMHPDNPASHPDLLATLAHQLKQNDFDLKYIYQTICNSKAYQRSSKPTGDNGDDVEFFSHSLVRGLHPQQLYDSLVQVIGAEPTKIEGGPKKGGGKGGAGAPRQKFIDFFTGDDGYKPLEYQSGIPQALLLMNAKQFNSTTKAIALATKAGKTPEGVVEQLFLVAYARRPSAAELQKMTAYVQKQSTPSAGYADVLWALANSSEFALNH